MRSGLTGLRVGRAHTDKTSQLLVPTVFWITGAFGMVAGLWRLWISRHAVLQGVMSAGGVIAGIHCFTLAGLTMVMMGALYQLVPVLLNAKPVRTGAALSQWVIYTIGIIVFVIGLIYNSPLSLSLGGVGLVGGISFFVVNIGGRISHRTTWNITGWFFTGALGYLSLTILMGALLAWRYVFGTAIFSHALTVHMTIAVGGWFGLLVSGVSYRLWAMFGRKHHEPTLWFVTWSFINGAVMGIVAGNVLGVYWLQVLGWGFQIIAFAAFVGDLIAGGLFDRRTMRDPVLRAAGSSLVFLGVFEVLGTIAVLGHHYPLWIPALWAYGLGWVGLSFLSFSQKLFPFMIWLHRYAHAPRGRKAPRLDDIWRPWWVYGPSASAFFGLITMLIAWGFGSGGWFSLGLALEALAWVSLVVMGTIAFRGPHRLHE